MDKRTQADPLRCGSSGYNIFCPFYCFHRSSFPLCNQELGCRWKSIQVSHMCVGGWEWLHRHIGSHIENAMVIWHIRGWINQRVNKSQIWSNEPISCAKCFTISFWCDGVWWRHWELGCRKVASFGQGTKQRAWGWGREALLESNR